MSAVKATAKASVYLFSFFVVFLVAGAIYLYVNMNSLAQQLTEKYASEALGVAVKIGEMDIQLDIKTVIVRNVTIANPKGYTKPHAITVKDITIAGDSFSSDLLTFNKIGVNGTDVTLEVVGQGTNLGDLKKSVEAKSARTSEPSGDEIKVIIKKLAMTKAQLNPSVTLIKQDLEPIQVPDIHLKGIGQKENGVHAQDAIAQVMQAVLQNFNKSANSAGFLKGLSLDALNDIGVSTVDVFKKNAQETFDKRVNQIKGLFE